MPIHPSFSRRRHRRLGAVAQRLMRMLRALDTADRRAPLPAAILGPRRRALAEAKQLAPEIAFPVPEKSAMPVDVFVAMMGALAGLLALLRGANRRAYAARAKSYPRTPERD